MPTYDYRCTACDTQFEVSRPMGASDPVECPSCEAPAKKVFSPVGVAFKGSGFHNTDYRPASKGSSTCTSGDSCPAAGSCDKTGG